MNMYRLLMIFSFVIGISAGVLLAQKFEVAPQEQSKQTLETTPETTKPTELPTAVTQQEKSLLQAIFNFQIKAARFSLRILALNAKIEKEQTKQQEKGKRELLVEVATQDDVEILAKEASELIAAAYDLVTAMNKTLLKGSEFLTTTTTGATQKAAQKVQSALSSIHAALLKVRAGAKGVKQDVTDILKTVLSFAQPVAQTVQQAEQTADKARQLVDKVAQGEIKPEEIEQELQNLGQQVQVAREKSKELKEQASQILGTQQESIESEE